MASTSRCLVRCFSHYSHLLLPLTPPILPPPDSDSPQAPEPDAIELVETGTSYFPYFPRTIRLPTDTASPKVITSDAEYTLLDLGITTRSCERAFSTMPPIIGVNAIATSVNS
jgi:hypothetical protein